MPPLIKPSRSKPSISVTQEKFPVAPETAWVTVSLISLTSLDTLMKYPFTSLKAVTSYQRRSGSGKASKWTFFPVSATLPKIPIQSKSEVLMNPLYSVPEGLIKLIKNWRYRHCLRFPLLKTLHLQGQLTQNRNLLLLVFQVS